MFPTQEEFGFSARDEGVINSNLGIMLEISFTQSAGYIYVNELSKQKLSTTADKSESAATSLRAGSKVLPDAKIELNLIFVNNVCRFYRSRR